MASNFENRTEVESRYSVGKEIGSGVYGVIMQATDSVTDETVAIKFKKFDTATGQLKCNLDIEIIAYERLKGIAGIPRAISYGRTFLAMELLGPSLTVVQQINSYKPISIRSILLIAEQLIARIESIHANGIFHRDIKMDNLLMGLGSKSNLIYIIDFGIAMIDVSKVLQQTLRKVDLLMIGHVIKCLYQIPGSTEITKYFEYCNKLQSEDAINYEHLKGIFEKAFRSAGYTGNVLFE